MPLYLLPMEIDRDRHAGGDFLSDGRQPANVTPGRLTREDDGAIDSECADSDRQVDALAAEIDPFVLDERAGPTPASRRAERGPIQNPQRLPSLTSVVFLASEDFARVQAPPAEKLA